VLVRPDPAQGVRGLPAGAGELSWAAGTSAWSAGWWSRGTVSGPATRP